VQKVPLFVDFRDLGGTGAGDVWAAGTAGGLARWDGSAWRSVTGESTAGYSSIAIVSANLGAATTDKRLLVWDGTHWDSVFGRPSFDGIRAVAPLGSAGRFVAVGDAGLIVAVDGKTWTRAASGVKGALRALAVCGDDVIAVGEAAVRRGAKGEWKPLAAPPVPVTAAVARCDAGGTRVAAVAAVGGDELLVLDVRAGKAGKWSRTTVSKGASLTDLAPHGKGLIAVGKGGVVATRAEWEP
jgi:hypothetical protein